MNAIKLAALVVIGGAHVKSLYDQAKETPAKRDVTQIVVSGGIVALAGVGIAAILQK